MLKKVKKKSPRKKRVTTRVGANQILIIFPTGGSIPNAADLFFTWGLKGTNISNLVAQVSSDSDPEGAEFEDLPSPADWAFEFDSIGGNVGDTVTLTVTGDLSGGGQVQQSVDFTLG